MTHYHTQVERISPPVVVGSYYLVVHISVHCSMSNSNAAWPFDFQTLIAEDSVFLRSKHASDVSITVTKTTWGQAERTEAKTALLTSADFRQSVRSEKSDDAGFS